MDADNAQLRMVIWVDSNTRSGWHHPADQDYGPMEVVSVGWVLHETDQSVTLSGSVVFGDDFQAADTMTIPKVCVVREKALPSPRG